MRFIHTTLFQIAGLLCSGILTAHFFPQVHLSLWWLGIAFVALVILWWAERKRLVVSSYFGIFACLIFFGIGMANYELRLPHFRSDHFTHHLQDGSPQYAQLKIKTELKPDRYHSKYIAKVTRIDTVSSVGRILVYVPLDRSLPSLLVDEELFVYALLKPLAPPKNPYQFDYSNYLKHLEVYADVRLDSLALREVRIGSSTLRGMALRFRAYLVRQLSRSGISLDERAILQAFVLGQKKDISQELLEDYADAGAIHILAVSGLHVGILFLILSFSTRWLVGIHRGSYIQSVSIILFLWGYAFITGGSPSVTRAVTMFSFLALAQQLGRTSYSLNNLGLSFIVLLLVKPNWLFHVGFQLSYLAVFFIIWTQPKFYAIWQPRYRLLRYFWGLVTVSIAAQLGVLPLSIYYFHQFPGLFLLTNLVIIPLLGALLFMGLVVVVLSGFNLLPDILAYCYSFLLKYLNSFITWIAQQQTFILKEITLSEIMTFWMYAFLISLILLWKNFRIRFLVTHLCILAMGVAILFYERERSNDHEFIVFHKSRSSLVGLRSHYDFQLLTNDSTTFEDRFPIKGYKEQVPLRLYRQKPLPSVFRFQGKTVLIIDSLGLFPRNANVDVVILSQSPRLHFERFLRTHRPEVVIADGSNYHSYVNRWAKSCERHNVPFHHTYAQGAYLLKIR